METASEQNQTVQLKYAGLIQLKVFYFKLNFF